MAKHKVFMTRTRRLDFIPSDHDVHGVAWDTRDPHPGWAIFQGRDFLGYSGGPDDIAINEKDAIMTDMSEDKMREIYEKAKLGNPDLTFEGFVEMKEKQAAAKNQKKKNKDGKQVDGVEPPKKKVKKAAPVQAESDSKETLTIDDAVKMVSPVDPTDIEKFQEQMKISGVHDSFHQSLKAYAESLWGPFGGIDPAFEDSLKSFAVKRWGPFASDVPKEVDTIDVEELVDNVYAREDLSESLGLKNTYVLKWSWHYGKESKEFGSLKEALDYPAYLISFFRGFDFSNAGWKVFERKQSDDVEIKKGIKFKLTDDVESKKK